MDLLEQLAEARIREAQEAGEFLDLPGTGKPLELEDDSLIPEELRVAYRILKNAGFLPPELQARKDIHDAEQLLLNVEDTAERSRAQIRLQLLRARLTTSRGGRLDLRLEEAYYQQLIERLQHSGRD